MLCKIDSHSLCRHLIVPDGLECPPIGRVYQQHNQPDGHRGNQHRHKGRQADGCSTHCQLEGAYTHKVFQQVGSVGHRSQLAPLHDSPQDFRKAQRCNRQIVAFQPQHRQADQIGQRRRQQARQHHRQQHTQKCAEAAQSLAENLRERHAHRRIIILIHRVPGIGGNGENRVGIRADQHKPGVTQGKQPRKPIQQVHGHCRQGIHAALLQHRQQHGHFVCGLDDLIQHNHQHQKQCHRHKSHEGAFFAFLIQHNAPPFTPYR